MSMPPLPPRTPSQRLRDAVASRFTRTAILWVFLIVMFIVLWQVFSERQQAVPGGAETASAPVEWLSVLTQWVPLLVLAGVFAVFYLRFRTFAAANKRAVDLMAAGDSAAAAQSFRRLARTPLAPAAVARLNLGLALLRLGDLRGALEAFAAAERSRLKALRPMVAAMIALCDALAGELDAAGRWIEEARRRAESPASTTRVHLVAEAIVRVRRGDAPGAARLLDETWGEIERCTAADFVRAFRLVRAFAMESAGGAAAAQAPDLLSGARPFREGEYTWIAAGWPEMARYLATHGFETAA